MTVLDTLKSLLGLESKDRRGEDEGAAGVTVEREPEAEPEPISSPSGSGGSSGTKTVESDAETDDAATDEGEAAPAAEEPSGSEEPTDVLEGIGPTYAERLADAGVETVGDLAAADAAALVDDVENVGEGRLETWIERANEYNEA